jgi:Cytochrome P450
MTKAMPRPDAVTLPITRQTPFDPPGELGRWRDEAPLRRLAYPDGHLGWLATGYDAVRAVLGDPRFSNRVEIAHVPLRQMMVARDILRFPPGMFLRMDPPEHTRYRRLLTGQFTVRRMRLLEPRIEAIVADRLAEMAAAGPPADLVPAYALPIPSLVICELLGVPYRDHERFQRDSATLLALERSEKEKLAAFDDLFGYLGDLVRHKRDEPGDDLLSGLAASGELSHAELTGVALLLLVAGHETTANMIALGTFTLLRHPGQLAAVRDEPGVAERAVEELLRYLTIVQFGPTRTATEDVEIEGRTIRAGETVTLALAAANRDPARFDRPDELDVRRPVAAHLAFGHGVHQCLGQQLARTELRVALPALLRRFPGLRLAVPYDEVPMRTDMNIYGVHRLPVTW